MIKRFLVFITIFSLSINAWSEVPWYLKLHQYQVKHLRTNDLPTSYSSRNEGLLLAPRDQVINGPCWAMASSDVMQAYLTKNNIANEYISPQSLTNCVDDCFVYEKNNGGNLYLLTALLARLKGPIYDKVAPYNPYNNDCPSLAKEHFPCYLLGIDYLPADDIYAIKKAVYTYGSAFTEIYYDHSYYNKDTNTYEYTGDALGPNHGVSIVGWDDSKEAFLIKGTYGTNTYDEGYFWLKYTDKFVQKVCAAIYDNVDTDAIDNVNTYSLTGYTGTFGFDNPDLEISGIVQFSPQGEELITHIGTFTVNPNTKIIVEVLYEDQFLHQSEEIIVPYPGYYTYALPAPVLVNKPYFVAITYLSEAAYPMPLEITMQNFSNPILAENVQWITSSAWNNQWTLVGKNTEYPFNLCIYAYTKNNAPTAIKENKLFDIDAVEDIARIFVYDTAGRTVATFSSVEELDTLKPNLYLLVFEKNNGSFVSKKIRLE